MVTIKSIGANVLCVVVLVLSAACGGANQPAAPSPQPSAAATPMAATTRQPSFPAVLKPARIFAFDHAGLPVQPYTINSRFVLYDDGTFELQYAAQGSYAGTYTETSGVVVFAWQGWSVAGPWGATGTLAGDSLAVNYNTIMQLSDFEDAVYVRPS